jgi:hypothetical protein
MAVIFSIAIMSLVVVVAFSTSDDERRSARAARESTLALYAADAGLRATLGNWPTAVTSALNPGDSADLGWTAIPNGGSYRPVILRVDSGGLQHYSVMVHGRRANSYGGQATVVSTVAGAARFKSAISTQGAFNVVGASNGIIDAYDSDIAPYNALTTDTAQVTSNGPITLYNTFTVKGDVKSAGTISYTTGVTGEIKPFSPPFPAHPIIPCPAGGYTPSANVPTTTPSRVSYSGASGVLEMQSNGQVTLSGSTKYYFNQVIVYGGATLTIDGTGQPVDIFVENLLGFEAGTVFNTSGKPTKVSFWSCGAPPNPQRWYIGGGPGSFFSVYAPNHAIELRNPGGGANNHIYGAIVGASVDMPAPMRFHYDAALTRMPSSSLTIVPGSWAQLPR